MYQNWILFVWIFLDKIFLPGFFGTSFFFLFITTSKAKASKSSLYRPLGVNNILAGGIKAYECTGSEFTSFHLKIPKTRAAIGGIPG